MVGRSISTWILLAERILSQGRKIMGDYLPFQVIFRIFFFIGEED